MSFEKDLAECQTAGELLTAIGVHYLAKCGAIDQTEDEAARAAYCRARALASTCNELAGVLDDEHSAVAYRTFLALGALQAGPDYGDARGVGASLSAKATQGEILSLTGGCPRDIDCPGALAVGRSLQSWANAQAQEDSRRRALRDRFARENVALWDACRRLEIQAEHVNDTVAPEPRSR